MRTLPIVAVLAATLLFGLPAPFAAAQHGSESGVGFQFLDDLLLPGRHASHHNPYEKPIETDRHDFTQSARTVGRGVVQLESGYSYFYKDTDDEIEQAHTMPEML